MHDHDDPPSGRHLFRSDLLVEETGWGRNEWISVPSTTGSDRLVVVNVTIDPGRGHAFHVHPDQEEVIVVAAGRIEQWIGETRRELGAGEAAYVGRGVVHASWALDDAPASLTVVLTPAVGATGYTAVDVAAPESWVSLREGPDGDGG